MVSVLPEDNKKIADDKKTVSNHTKDYREREMTEKCEKKQTETEIERVMRGRNNKGEGVRVRKEKKGEQGSVAGCSEAQFAVVCLSEMTAVSRCEELSEASQPEMPSRYLQSFAFIL